MGAWPEEVVEDGAAFGKGLIGPKEFKEGNACSQTQSIHEKNPPGDWSPGPGAGGKLRKWAVDQTQWK